MFNSFLVCAPSILPIKSSTARLDTPEILADPFLLAVLLPKRERSSKPGVKDITYLRVVISKSNDFSRSLD